MDFEHINFCQSCDAILDSSFVFDDFTGAFRIDAPIDAKSLTLYRIRLPYDIAVRANVRVDSCDCLIEGYSTFFDTNLNWM